MPSSVQPRSPQNQQAMTPQGHGRPAADCPTTAGAAAAPQAAARPESFAAAERQVIGEADAAPKQGTVGSKVSSNCFANGANQNAGNFITDRPSTRVHCRPGGNSTICLGGDPMPSSVQPRSPQNQRVTTPQGQGRPEVDRPAPAVAAVKPESSGAANRQAVSSNVFANGANQNAGNFITDRPSTRVHQGPGGRSSICLGDDTDSLRKATGERAAGAGLARRGAA